MTATAYPSCFGQYWEGIDGSPCKDDNCSALNECLAKFATKTLVEHQRKLGKGKATADALAKATDVDKKAIELAMTFQENMGLDPYNIPPPTTEETPEEPEEEPEEEEVEEGASEEPEPEPEKPKKPAKKKVAKKPATKKKATKKAAPPKKKKVVKKKVVKKKATKKAAPVNPTQASSAKSAKGLAKTKKATSAKSAKAQGGQKATREWGPQHNQNRWERERKRTPLIAKLTPGMVIPWAYKGESGKVTVRKGYYSYQGEKYPTLYSLVKLLAGVKKFPKQLKADGSRPKGTRELVAYSAVKFFKLKEFLKKKGLLGK